MHGFSNLELEQSASRLVGGSDTPMIQTGRSPMGMGEESIDKKVGGFGEVIGMDEGGAARAASDEKLILKQKAEKIAANWEKAKSEDPKIKRFQFKDVEGTKTPRWRCRKTDMG